MQQLKIVLAIITSVIRHIIVLAIFSQPTDYFAFCAFSDSNSCSATLKKVQENL